MVSPAYLISKITKFTPNFLTFLPYAPPLTFIHRSYCNVVARTKPRQDTIQIWRAFIPSVDFGKLAVMLTSNCRRKKRGIIATESLPRTASMGRRKVIQDRQTRRPGELQNIFSDLLRFSN